MVLGKHKNGFTIVELLIVIVVIGILAAITIIAFNGVTARGQAARVQADVVNAGKKLEAYKVSTSSSNQYPNVLSDAGITDTTGMTYNNSGDGSYCLTKIVNNATYSISSDQPTSMPGFCGAGSTTNRYQFNNSLNDMTASANGTPTNISYTTGQNGQANGAISLGGSSYVQLPASTDIPRPLSISVWVYPTSFGSGEGTFIVAADPGVRILLTPSGTVTGLASINGWYTASGGTATLNQWNHIVVTVSDTTMRTYLNGTGVGWSGLPSGTPVSYTSSTPYVIGSDNYVYNSYHNNAVGKIDDVVFYNRVLSEAEVKGLYASGAQ